MEIKIKIEAPNLEEAIHALAKAFTGVPATLKPPVEVVPSEDKKETVKQDPPKEEKEENDNTTKISLETVRVKLAELSQSGKQKEVKGLITSFGAKKLSDVPEDKYAELLEKAEGL